MPYEVVVVGGGIGGLTTAALLAARGVSVCLLERQSTPGGCVASFEKFGYSFESGAALYSLWGKGEIHERIFAELPVTAPEVRRIDPAYCVRLADRTDVTVTQDSDAFFLSLRTNFPECADVAVSFYDEAEARGNVLLSALETLLAHGWESAAYPSQLAVLAHDTTIQHLDGTSPRFQRFVDAQLQVFAQSTAGECSYLYSCLLAALRARGFFSIRGGAAALAETLAQSIKKSGGTIRLNSQALRLAYDASGGIAGVQLLTGETVTASRAVISNLTVWDTYGKLVGLERTPKEIRQRLKELTSSGVYQLFFGVAETQAQTLPAEHIIAVTDWPEVQDDSAAGQLTFTVAPSWDQRAPQGMRAATVHVPADVTDWFLSCRQTERTAGPGDWNPVGLGYILSFPNWWTRSTDRDRCTS